MFLAKSRISKTHSTYLDMWRGGSAIVVAAGHTVQIFAQSFPSILGRLSDAFAGAAVMAFFALSGFFIHKSLARCYSGALDWRSFMVARINRILLPFAACLLLTYLLWLLAPHFFASGSHRLITPSNRTEYSLDGFWRTALFLNNFFGPALSANGPLWSLTYEVWYYALACLFSLALLGFRPGWVAVPLLAALTVLDKWFLILGLVWLGGFWVSVQHANGQLPKLPRLPMWLLPALLLVAVLFVPEHFAGKASILFRLAFGAWMVWHLAAILSKETVPQSKLLAWTGGFSYSLYVFHFPILLFAYGVSERIALPALAFALVFAAVVGGPLERLHPLRVAQTAART